MNRAEVDQWNPVGLIFCKLFNYVFLFFKARLRISKRVDTGQMHLAYVDQKDRLLFQITITNEIKEALK